MQARRGQVVVLAGVAVFLVGSFLPFYRLGPPSDASLSLARQMVTGPTDGAGWVLGGILLLFAATAVVAVTAAVGLGDGGRVSATPVLVGAAATWSLTWVGVLLRSTGGLPLGVGYSVTWVGVAVVVVGTAIVVASARSVPAGAATSDVPSPSTEAHGQT